MPLMNVVFLVIIVVVSLLFFDKKYGENKIFKFIMYSVIAFMITCIFFMKSHESSANGDVGGSSSSGYPCYLLPTLIPLMSAARRKKNSLGK